MTNCEPPSTAPDYRRRWMGERTGTIEREFCGRAARFSDVVRARVNRRKFYASRQRTPSMGDPTCYRDYCPDCDRQVTITDEECPECGTPLPLEN